jgi:hypothetical protein
MIGLAANAGIIGQAIIAIGGAAAVIWGGIRYLPRFFAWLGRGWKRVKTTASGIEIVGLHQETLVKIPEYMEHGRRQLAEHGAKIEGVQGNLGRLTSETVAQRKQVDGLSVQLGSVANIQRAMLNTNSRAGVLHTDGRGYVTGINKTFAAWTGLDETSAKHLGWLNAIKSDELARFRASFFSAVNDGRGVDDLRVTLVHVATKQETQVEMSSDPIPPDAVIKERYFVTMQEIIVSVL